MSLSDYLQAQPLLRVAAVLMAGIAVGDAMAAGIPFGAWLAAIAVCLLAELLLRGHPYVRSVALLAAVFFAGVALIVKTDRQVAYPFRGYEAASYEAVVVGEPRVAGKVVLCDIAVTAMDGQGLEQPLTVRALVMRDSAGLYRRLQPGSGLRAKSVIQPLTRWRRDGNFDYVRYLHARGCRAQTFICRDDWQAERVSLASLPATDRLRLRALQLRHKLADYLATGGGENGNLANGDGQPTAIVAAMVLGDKHGLSNNTKDNYSAAGVSHILALSGLHLGVIYGFLTLLFGGQRRRRWLSQALILVAVWTYVVMVGMGASVVRAAVMLSLCSLCFVAGRIRASVNAIAVAAAAMLVANPLLLWDVGFQLSFASVFAILLLCNPIFHLLTVSLSNRLLRYAVEAVWLETALTVASQLGAAPLVAYYFGSFSCYVIFANLIVIPCATVIIYAALAVFLTAPIPALSALLSQVLAAVSSFLNSAVAVIASLPGASVSGLQINGVQVVCVYILIAAVCVAVTYTRRAGAEQSRYVVQVFSEAAA